jgi:hypothetical protein
LILLTPSQQRATRTTKAGEGQVTVTYSGDGWRQVAEPGDPDSVQDQTVCCTDVLNLQQKSAKEKAAYIYRRAEISWWMITDPNSQLPASTAGGTSEKLRS